VPRLNAAEPALRAIVLCVALCAGARAQDTFADVQTAAESGEFARALELARAQPQPLDALRAEVWLRFRARDFAQAQSAAERALALAPEELWLAERALACALWRRDPAPAQLALARFEASFSRARPSEREGFSSALAEASLQTASLQDSTARARAALVRARAVALCLLGAALAVLGGLALSLARARASH
jgi:hypothetical protein